MLRGSSGGSTTVSSVAVRRGAGPRFVRTVAGSSASAGTTARSSLEIGFVLSRALLGALLLCAECQQCLDAVVEARAFANVLWQFYGANDLVCYAYGLGWDSFSGALGR